MIIAVSAQFLNYCGNLFNLPSYSNILLVKQEIGEICKYITKSKTLLDKLSVISLSSLQE